MRPRDENKEQAIREKAIEMIINDGFDGLSMQKLAKAAGVSPATIYIYFKDRDDLLHQIITTEAKKMSDATLVDFDPDLSFEEGLRKQWQNRAAYFLRNPVRMQFVEQMKNTPVYEKTFKMDPAFLSAMQRFAHNAIDRKELIRLPLEVFWSIAYAPLYQLVKFHLTGRPVMSSQKNFVLDEKIMEQALQLVLKALRP
jgi:AcrR family transcriptional regulator